MFFDYNERVLNPKKTWIKTWVNTCFHWNSGFQSLCAWPGCYIRSFYGYHTFLGCPRVAPCHLFQGDKVASDKVQQPEQTVFFSSRVWKKSNSDKIQQSKFTYDSCRLNMWSTAHYHRTFLAQLPFHIRGTLSRTLSRTWYPFTRGTTVLHHTIYRLLLNVHCFFSQTTGKSTISRLWLPLALCIL